LCQLSLRKLRALHLLSDLKCDHTLCGHSLSVIKEALVAEEIIKVAADMLLVNHFDPRSCARRAFAVLSSPGGILTDFLTKP